LKCCTGYYLHIYSRCFQKKDKQRWNGPGKSVRSWGRWRVRGLWSLCGKEEKCLQNCSRKTACVGGRIFCIWKLFKRMYRVIFHSLNLFLSCHKIQTVFINVIIFALAVHIWNTGFNMKHVHVSYSLWGYVLKLNDEI
jgi:hypothetical protein